MSIRRIAVYGSVLLFLAATALIWWMVAAGPTTVYRTVRYNVSGIDDDRIFPRRTLTPAPRAFRFREAVNPEKAALSVRVNGRKDIPLICTKSWKIYFNSQNENPRTDATSIPATFLRVTVAI